MRGSELAREFHVAVVEPLVRAEFGEVSLVAGRFGAGSDVLGLDDAVSADHDWGLRTTLLVDSRGAEITQFLEQELPESFRGHPVRFPMTSDPVVRHRVEVCSVPEFVRARLGVTPDQAWTTADWLSFTGQAVLEITAGPVFSDDDGGWDRLCRRLSWYPDDVWRYLVASSWRQLEQELPFVGRTGSRGDDLGSRVLAGRLVDVAMHLGLLLDRVWAPYSKWVGSVFVASPSGRVAGDLARAVTAPDWPTREAGLCAALEELLRHQSSVGLPVTPHATWRFHDREFRGVGSVGQFSRSTDVLVRAELRRDLAGVVS